MKIRIIAGVGILAWLCAARVSFGQTAVDAADLFERGKKLMDAGDFAVACPMIQESYDLEPKVGRLYTLATCRDREGRTATALDHYRTYLQAVSEMNEQTRPKHADREKTATERVQALEAQVPKLKLVWRGDVPKRVKVTVDGGNALARLNTEWPMNPGEHWVVVKRGGGVEEPRGATVRSYAVTLHACATAELDVTLVEVPKRAGDTSSPAPNPRKRLPIIVIGGAIGLAAVGTSIGLYMATNQRSDDADEMRKGIPVGVCGVPDHPQHKTYELRCAQLKSTLVRHDTLMNVGTGMLVTGIEIAAVTLVYAVVSSKKPAPTAWIVVPVMGSTYSGVVATGSF